jgi:hypothetical protein
MKLSSVEAEKRDLEVRLARVGGLHSPTGQRMTPRTPNSRRMTIGGFGSLSRHAALSPCLSGEAELQKCLSDAKHKAQFDPEDKRPSTAAYIAVLSENEAAVNLMPSPGCGMPSLFEPSSAV